MGEKKLLDSQGQELDMQHLLDVFSTNTKPVSHKEPVTKTVEGGVVTLLDGDGKVIFACSQECYDALERHMDESAQ